MAPKSPSYWFVGAAKSGKDDHYDDFIENGYWKLFWARGKQPAQETKYLLMKPGDWIAIKKMVGGPFSQGKIRVRALGTIKDVSRQEPRVEVNWLLTGMNEIIDGHGFYSSIHGPFNDQHDAVEAGFKRLLSAANKTNSVSSLSGDLADIFQQSGLDETTRKALVDARIGQGKFRTDVLNLWNGCCAVTGVRTSEAIRASHIKPWRDSTHQERLDPSNGIPLVATLDAIFDTGLISFETSGKMTFSPTLAENEKTLLHLHGARLRRKPTCGTIDYLNQHRATVFRP